MPKVASLEGIPPELRDKIFKFSLQGSSNPDEYRTTALNIVCVWPKFGNQILAVAFRQNKKIERLKVQAGVKLAKKTVKKARAAGNCRLWIQKLRRAQLELARCRHRQPADPFQSKDEFPVTVAAYRRAKDEVSQIEPQAAIAQRKYLVARDEESMAWDKHAHLKSMEKESKRTCEWILATSPKPKRKLEILEDETSTEVVLAWEEWESCLDPTFEEIFEALTLHDMT